MTPPDDPEIPDEDPFTADLIALMQADEDDEAVYGWMVEDMLCPVTEG